MSKPDQMSLTHHWYISGWWVSSRGARCLSRLQPGRAQPGAAPAALRSAPPAAEPPSPQPLRARPHQRPRPPAAHSPLRHTAATTGPGGLRAAAAQSGVLCAAQTQPCVLGPAQTQPRVFCAAQTQSCVFRPAQTQPCVLCADPAQSADSSRSRRAHRHQHHLWGRPGGAACVCGSSQAAASGAGGRGLHTVCRLPCLQRRWWALGGLRPAGAGLLRGRAAGSTPAGGRQWPTAGSAADPGAAAAESWAGGWGGLPGTTCPAARGADTDGGRAGASTDHRSGSGQHQLQSDAAAGCRHRSLSPSPASSASGRRRATVGGRQGVGGHWQRRPREHRPAAAAPRPGVGGRSRLDRPGAGAGAGADTARPGDAHRARTAAQSRGQPARGDAGVPAVAGRVSGAAVSGPSQRGRIVSSRSATVKPALASMRVWITSAKTEVQIDVHYLLWFGVAEKRRYCLFVWTSVIRLFFMRGRVIVCIAVQLCEYLCSQKPVTPLTFGCSYTLQAVTRHGSRGLCRLTWIISFIELFICSSAQLMVL